MEYRSSQLVERLTRYDVSIVEGTAFVDAAVRSTRGCQGSGGRAGRRHDGQQRHDQQDSKGEQIHRFDAEGFV